MTEPLLAPPPFAGRYANLPGVRLWYVDTGGPGPVLVLLHASDIPMYDSRINIAGWILLAGLRCYR